MEFQRQRSTIQMAVTRRRMKLAETLFEELEEKPVDIFNMMLRGYLAAMDTRKCWIYFDRLFESGLRPDLYTYSIMFLVCKTERDFTKARELWKEMEGDGLHPDCVVYNSYMQVFLRTGKHEKAVALLEEMKERGVNPDIVTFNTLISGLARQETNDDQSLQMIDQVIKEMHNSGMEADFSTYKGLFNASLQKGNVMKAVRYANEMMKRDLFKNGEQYAMLINDYAKAKKLSMEKVVSSQCWKLYLHMLDKEMRPNLDIHEALLKVFVSMNYWRNAFALLDFIGEKDMKVSGRMYNALLTGLAKQRSFGSESMVVAKILIEEIHKSAIHLDFYMYSSIITVFLQARDLRAATHYFNAMKASKVGVHKRIYNQFFEYYADSRYITDWQNSFKESMKLLEELRELVDPDQFSFLSLTRIASRCFEWEALDKLMAEMKERRLVLPASSYGTILSMCAKTKDPANIQRAWKYFNEMKEYKLPINVIGYTTMINTCITSCDMDAALDLLSEMDALNIRPNERTFVSLMNVAAEVGKLDLVHTFFDEMLKRGLQRDITAHCALIQACGKTKQVDKVQEAYEAVRANGMFLMLPAFNALISAAALCERSDLIYTYFDEFRRLKGQLNSNAYAQIAAALEQTGDAEGAAAIQELSKEETGTTPAAATA